MNDTKAENQEKRLQRIKDHETLICHLPETVRMREGLLLQCMAYPGNKNVQREFTINEHPDFYSKTFTLVGHCGSKRNVGYMELFDGKSFRVIGTRYPHNNSRRGVKVFNLRWNKVGTLVSSYGDIIRVCDSFFVTNLFAGIGIGGLGRGMLAAAGPPYTRERHAGHNSNTAEWDVKDTFVLYTKPKVLLPPEVENTSAIESTSESMSRLLLDTYLGRTESPPAAETVKVEPGWYQRKETKETRIVFGQNEHIVTTSAGTFHNPAHFMKAHVRLNVEPLSATELTEYVLLSQKDQKSEAELARLTELVDKMERPEQEKQKRRIMKEMFGYEYSSSGYGAIIK